MYLHAARKRGGRLRAGQPGREDAPTFNHFLVNFLLRKTVSRISFQCWTELFRLRRPALARRSTNMKTMRILALGLCGALAGSSSLLFAGQSANDQAALVKSGDNANGKAENVAPKTAKLSWGLDDVVKLSKAGVDESVILTYVQNSGVAYNPTAQDVIQLRELGVSPQVTAALMQHGSEVRQAATAEAQKQAQAAPPAPAPAQPAPVYSAPTYVAPASTVTYIGYPSYAYSYPSYYAPTYYSYPYCYPRSYGYYGGFYPRVSFGINFGHVGFSGFHGGFHGGFGHGGFSHGGFSHHGGGHHR